MSDGRTIAKLEALLDRVRARAAAPRLSRVATAAAVAPSPAAPPPIAAPPTAPAGFEPPGLAAQRQPASPPTVPPPSSGDEATLVRAPAPTEAEVVVDVEVQEISVEAVIGVPAEEIPVAEASESRERLVAAEPVAAEALPELVVDVSPEPPVAQAALEESPPDLLAAVEEVEEAPLSSRRPVAPQPEERIADIAFGAEEPSPPRHTPPPESGRLPAAPAIEFENDADITGVREAPAVAVVEAQRSRELTPQVTRPAFRPSDAVADVVGEAQRFAPSTFGALLDASLAL
ncbi:MAG TPA: hypothetical protein VGG39_33370 [Polyangiaceae bacterium]